MENQKYNPNLIGIVEERINALPILQHLGIRLRGGDPGEMITQIDVVKEFHLGGQERGAYNGAVLTGLLDCAMVSAAVIRRRGARCATVELSVRFMKPAIGSSIFAVGRVLASQGSLLFCDGRVCDAKRRVFASGAAVVMEV